MPPCGLGGVLGEPARERVAAQRPAGPGREQRVAVAPATFLEPSAKHGGGRVGERRDALPAALSERGDVRAGTELKIGDPHGGEL
jgi:hypothetical protein